MISLISDATQTNGTQTSVAAANALQTSSASPAKTSDSSQTHNTPSVPVDTVHISSAAQIAIREAIETPAQTAREASSGDQQAQRLLVKEQPVK